WVTLLDDHGHPNRGPFPASHALIKLDSTTRQAEYLFEYYAYGHFMRFIQRGAVRIFSTPGNSDLANVAFRNPDGSIVLVLVNAQANDCHLELELGKVRFHHRVSGTSIVTVRWPEPHS